MSASWEIPIPLHPSIRDSEDDSHHQRTRRSRHSILASPTLWIAIFAFVTGFIGFLYLVDNMSPLIYPGTDQFPNRHVTYNQNNSPKKPELIEPAHPSPPKTDESKVPEPVITPPVRADEDLENEDPLHFRYPSNQTVSNYTDINHTMDLYRGVYHQFSQPPRILPGYDRKVHENIKQSKLVTFSSDPRHKHKLLLNPYEPRYSSSLSESVFPDRASWFDTDADNSSFKVSGQSESPPPKTAQPVTASTHSFSTQGTNNKDLSRELNWVSFESYLKDINSEHGKQAYKSTLSPKRQEFEKKRYQARYATHISLDTSPPTIKFDPAAVIAPKSYYAKLTKLSKPLSNPIKDPANRINSTNPFYEYLHLKSDNVLLRKEAVSREIAHAMTGYSLANFGSDEFFPVTQTSSLQWGFGLNVVDAIDTLMLAENEEHVEMCLEFIANQLYFERRGISLFEVTIRGLGGLLSAYSMRPEHTVLLERAYELGELLVTAFAQQSPFFPSNGHKLGDRPQPKTKAVTSEIATLQIEFETLARLTGEFRFVYGVRKMLQYLYATHTPLLGEHIVHSITNNTMSAQSQAESGAQDWLELSPFESQALMSERTRAQQDDSKTANIPSEPTSGAPNSFQSLANPSKHFYVADPTNISISGMIDSAYEYYIKLWVLHNKPPYRLPLRTSSNPRPTITWLGEEYSPEDQDRLWRKFDGLYAPDTGIYIPLHLYFDFLRAFPNLLQLSSVQSLLFAAQVRSGKIDPALGHLDCFMGGALAYGIAHGVLDDQATINELYKADCIYKNTGIPCDFVTTTDAQTKSKLPLFYAHVVPNFDPALDFITTTQYVRDHHSRWANDLTHTCAMSYASTETQIASELALLNFTPTANTALFSKKSYTSRSIDPQVQDLYSYFRHINTNTTATQKKLRTNTVPLDHPSHQRKEISPRARWSPPSPQWIAAQPFVGSPSPAPSGPMPIPPLILVAGDRAELPEGSLTNASAKTASPLDFKDPKISTYILRPETVESLFILWKTTRNEFYREQLWGIFLNIVFYCRVFTGGYTTLRTIKVNGFSQYGRPSSPPSVTTPPTWEAVKDGQTFSKDFIDQLKQRDVANQWHWGKYHSQSISHNDIVKKYASSPAFYNGRLNYGSGPPASPGTLSWNNFQNKMETWFLAETLKYIFLAFAEDETLRLDQWVFSTEAHPVRI